MDLSLLKALVGIVLFGYLMVVYGTLIRLNCGERVELIFQLQKSYNIVSPPVWFEKNPGLRGAILWIFSPILFLLGILIVKWIEGWVDDAFRGFSN